MILEKKITVGKTKKANWKPNPGHEPSLGKYKLSSAKLPNKNLLPSTEKSYIFFIKMSILLKTNLPP